MLNGIGSKQRWVRVYIEFIEKRSAWILALAGAVTVAMAMGLPRLRIVENSTARLISESHPLIVEMNRVDRAFAPSSRRVVVSVESQGRYGLTQSSGLELIKGISDALRSNPMLIRGSVLSLTTAVDIVSQDNDIGTEYLITDWPKNRREELALQQRLKAQESVYGRLISKDFRSALVLATAFEQPTLTEIHRSLSESIKPFVNAVPGVKVQLVGDVEVNYQINAGIQFDVVVFAFLSLLLVLMGFFLAFRAWHGVVIPFATIVMGIVWTMGLIGWLGEPMNIISAAVPVVLVVVGNAMSIHVYHVLRKALESGKSLRQALQGFLKTHLPPMALATSTTVIGSLSLLTFKFIPIQNLGVFVAFGSLVLFLGALFLIPALMSFSVAWVDRVEKTFSMGISGAAQLAKSTVAQVPIAGKVTGALSESVKLTMQGGVDGALQGARRARLIQRMLHELANWAVLRPWSVLGAALLVMGLGAVGTTRLMIYFTNTEMLPKSNPVKEATLRMEKTFGGTVGFSIMLDTGRPSGALEPDFLNTVDGFLWTAAQDPLISQTFSIVELLKKVHRVLEPQASSSQALPKSREALAQYLLLLEMNPSSLDLTTLVTSDRSKLRLSLMVNTDDSRKAERVYQRLRALSEAYFADKAQVSFAGGQMSSIVLMRNIVWGKIQNILSSMLCVFLLIVLVFRSLSRGFFSLLAMPIGIAANFGFMGFVGLPLDMITAIATSIAMGFGTDLSIHMLAAIEEAYHDRKRATRRHDIAYAVRHAIETRGETMIYNALSDFMGFGVLIFSQFLTIQSLAILMVWSLSVLQLSSLVVIPAAVRLFQPECITHHRRRHHIMESPLRVTMKWAGTGALVLVLSSVVWVMDAWCAPDPNSLLDKAVEAIYTNNEESLYTMKLQGASGDVALRKMKVFFKGQRDGQSGASKLLIRFVEPADIRGTGLLTLKSAGGSGDQYLYLPALKKSRRIRGGNKDESFLGSDFTMGDLSVDRQDGLVYQHTGVEKVDGADCYVLTGKLPAGAATTDRLYSQKRMWIRKDNSMAVKTEFFNPAQQLEKVMTLSGVHRDGPRWVADAITMKNVLTGHSTVLSFEKREAKNELSDGLFTVHALERGQ